MYDRLCNVMGPSRTCSDLPGRADLQVGGRQVPRGLNVFASMEIDVQSVAKQHVRLCDDICQEDPNLLVILVSARPGIRSTPPSSRD